MSNTTKYEYTVGDRLYPDEAIELIGMDDRFDSVYDMAESAAETEYTCGDPDDSEWPMLFSIFKDGVNIADISVGIELIPVFRCSSMVTN